jgi:hypothetical protein
MGRAWEMMLIGRFLLSESLRPTMRGPEMSVGGPGGRVDKEDEDEDGKEQSKWLTDTMYVTHQETLRGMDG